MPNADTVSGVYFFIVFLSSYTHTPKEGSSFIKDGRVPYMQAVDLLPDDMHFSIVKSYEKGAKVNALQLPKFLGRVHSGIQA